MDLNIGVNMEMPSKAFKTSSEPRRRPLLGPFPMRFRLGTPRFTPPGGRQDHEAALGRRPGAGAAQARRARRARGLLPTGFAGRARPTFGRCSVDFRWFFHHFSTFFHVFSMFFDEYDFSPFSPRFRLPPRFSAPFFLSQSSLRSPRTCRR